LVLAVIWRAANTDVVGPDPVRSAPKALQFSGAVGTTKRIPLVHRLFDKQDRTISGKCACSLPKVKLCTRIVSAVQSVWIQQEMVQLIYQVGATISCCCCGDVIR